MVADWDCNFIECKDALIGTGLCKKEFVDIDPRPLGSDFQEVRALAEAGGG